MSKLYSMKSMLNISRNGKFVSLCIVALMLGSMFSALPITSLAEEDNTNWILYYLNAPSGNFFEPAGEETTGWGHYVWSLQDYAAYIHAVISVPGFMFVGWQSVDFPGQIFTGGEIIYVAETTFSGVWLATSFYVTYNMNGVLSSIPMDNNLYSQGAAVNIIGRAVPTYQGYTFLGWAFSSSAVTPDFAYSAGNNAGGSFSPSSFQMGNGNVVLYAVWQIQTLVVLSYLSLGHTSGSPPSDPNSPYQTGSVATVLGQGSLLRSGYNFLGWNTDNEATVAQYTAGQTFVISSNTFLYAVWQQTNTFSVSYNANGATGGSVPVNPNFYAPGASVAVQANPGNLFRSGYTFRGWARSAGASSPEFTVNGNSVSPSSFQMGNANVVLYAVWQLVPTFGVTYNANWPGGVTGTGTVPLDPNVYVQGASVAVQANTGNLARSGYTFRGWARSAGASSPEFTVNGNSVSPSSFQMGNANVVLYAVWQSVQTFSVTYFGNGHTGGVAPLDSSSPYVASSIVTVLNQGSLVRAGYAFIGWNTNQAATTAQYTPGQTFMINQNTNLHAIWSTNPPDIVIDQITTGSTQGFIMNDIGTYTSTVNAAYGQEFMGNGYSVTSAQFRILRQGSTVSDTIFVAAIYASISSVFGSGMPSGSALAVSQPIVFNTISTNLAWVSFTFDGTFQVTAGTPYFIALQCITPGLSEQIGVDPRLMVYTGSTTGGVFVRHNGWIWSSGSGSLLFMLYGKPAVAPPDTFTVSYNGNYATSGSVPVDLNDYLAGDTVTLKPNVGNLVRSGYNFLGWARSAVASLPDFVADSSSVSPSSLVMGNSNVVLYAVWQVIPAFSVTYFGNGNTGGIAPVDPNSPYVLYSAVTVLGQGSLTRSGYVFLGWHTSSAATTPMYTQGSVFNMLQSVELYAIWQSVPTFTVTFNPGSHGTFTPKVVTGLVNGDPTPSPPAITGSLGWLFTGWSPTVASTVVDNVVYTAQWLQESVVATFTVTFVDWDGAVLKTQIVVSGAGASAPADPKRPGFVFSGWDRAFNSVSSNLVVTATYQPSSDPSPVVPGYVGETRSVDLFFRSDTYDTFTFAGYGLDDVGTTGSAKFESTFGSQMSVAFGFRVWLVSESAGMVELTDGFPVGVVIFVPAVNGTWNGYVSGVWNCPNVPVLMGDQALYVVMYSAAEDGANTVARAEFVSPVLMTDYIVGSSWVFTWHVVYTGSAFTVSWDGRAGASGIGNVVFAAVSDFDMMFFKLMTLDLLGFIVYPYVSIFGGLFYVIAILAMFGAYYIWHGKASIILFMLVLFGSAGGLVFVFLPLPTNLLVWALMAVVLGVLLFRVFR